MSCLGNILWIVFGGFIAALEWLLAGILCCITIVGIPFGIQCFKIAGLVLAPFGKNVSSKKLALGSTIGNILWIIFLGWELALSHFIIGLVLCITIIGIPFGKQHFKLAGLALTPFGSKIS